jgi:signal transduction histidine kinase
MTQILVYLAETPTMAITDEGAAHGGDREHAHRPPRRRHCRRRPPRDYVCLSFRDTDAAWNDETQAQIFDPFFSTKSSAPDTGMGLAIILRYRQTNRGFIRLASQPDSGTCFFIYLPRHGQPAPTVPGSNANLPPPPCRLSSRTNHDLACGKMSRPC